MALTPPNRPKRPSTMPIFGFSAKQAAAAFRQLTVDGHIPQFENCRNCGAPNAAATCKYCGTVYAPTPTQDKTP